MYGLFLRIIRGLLKTWKMNTCIEFIFETGEKYCFQNVFVKIII